MNTFHHCWGACVCTIIFIKVNQLVSTSNNPKSTSLVHYYFNSLLYKSIIFCYIRLTNIFITNLYNIHYLISYTHYDISYFHCLEKTQRFLKIIAESFRLPSPITSTLITNVIKCDMCMGPKKCPKHFGNSQITFSPNILKNDILSWTLYNENSPVVTIEFRKRKSEKRKKKGHSGIDLIVKNVKYKF